MSDISQWKPLADDMDNNVDFAPPDGFPEGMQTGQTNNSSREVQAATRRWFETPTWRDLGLTVTFINSTTAEIAGDVTALYQVNQRVVSNGAGPVKGTIINVVATTNTTLTITWDDGNPWTVDFTYFRIGPESNDQPISLQMIAGINAAVAALIPAGFCMWSATENPVSGNDQWLVCNGQVLDTSTYPELFAAIGYIHGGSGSTFNVPNMRGRAAWGRDGGQGVLTSAFVGGDPDQRGLQFGTESVSLTADNNGPHAHTITNRVAAGEGAFPRGGNAINATDIQTESSGLGTAHQNLPPGILGEWYIFTGKSS